MSIAMNRIDNIRKFIFQSPIKFKDHNIFITVSIGVSEFPTHGKNMDTVLRFADKALYRAKLAGRNRIFSFDRKTDGDTSDPVIVHKKTFITGSSG
jgi:diguanylate cyclase (GGDEF)-like protein